MLLYPIEEGASYSTAEQYYSKQEAQKAGRKCVRYLKKSMACPDDWKFRYDVHESGNTLWVVRMYAQNLTAPEESMLSRSFFIGWTRAEQDKGLDNLNMFE